jgi:hypothetical protein
MRQVETSRTMVFKQPRHARAFFDALVADNLDVGRQDRIEIIFGRKLQHNTPSRFHTLVDRHVTSVTLNGYYKHSRIKQYLKDGRALRIETVINDTGDLKVQRGIEHLDELRTKAQEINTRILAAEHVSLNTVVASPAFEQAGQPTRDQAGRRASALRFGDPRVMTLLAALSTTMLAATGITHKSLRALITGIMSGYTASQMSYDLRRLKLKGLIVRVPHTNTYRITGDGLRLAVIYTKIGNRLLRPLLALGGPGTPPDIRQALRVLETHTQEVIHHARLTPAPTTEPAANAA